VTRYLLDTNACIALLNGRPPAVDARVRRALQAGADIALSAIVLAELWYGVVRSVRADENADRLRAFSAGPLPVVAFDDDDARVAGAIRGALAARGTPIGPYDVLIAAQALQRNYTLVTANVGEFARVDQLRWENWAEV
jgi:tRNA(fMet)-specific endonuclease VapC